MTVLVQVFQCKVQIQNTKRHNIQTYMYICICINIILNMKAEKRYRRRWDEGRLLHHRLDFQGLP